MSDQTAHEILEQHITNVPTVTAQAIRRAIAEYEEQSEVLKRLSVPPDELSDVMGKFAKVGALLLDVDEALGVGERTSHGIRVAIAKILEKPYPATRAPSTNGGSS